MISLYIDASVSQAETGRAALAESAASDIHTHTHTHTHIYINLCIYLSIDQFILFYIDTSVAQAETGRAALAESAAYIYIYMYIYICVYIHIYVHTYIYICISMSIYQFILISIHPICRRRLAVLRWRSLRRQPPQQRCVPPSRSSRPFARNWWLARRYIPPPALPTPMFIHIHIHIYIYICIGLTLNPKPEPPVYTSGPPGGEGHTHMTSPSSSVGKSAGALPAPGPSRPLQAHRLA